MTLAIEPAKLTNNRSTLAKGGLLIVTDDGRGVAGKVATDLRALGHPVVRVRHGSSEGEVEGVDLNSEADVKALIDRLRDRGSLAGVVHLLPLRDQGSIGLDPVVWESGTGPEVRGLFLLAKASAAELERASERGGACLIAATRLGGAFGSAGAALENFPAGQGGLAGLVKTLAHEWPAVRSRVVDLEPSGEVEVVAAEVVREIFAKDARAEVGYRSGRRQALRAIASPLPELRESDPTAWFPKGAPLILTGGARGITAAVARELARLWQPTLLLIGSGPLPSPEEGPETSGIQDEPLLKAALLESLRNERGEAISPTELERAYRAVRRDREIRATWRDCRALGAEVHYAQADVRDPEALQRVLAEWREEFGPPVGLIHGAGVIRDKLLTDKTPAAFDQVWGTKLVGALNLAREIDASRLRFAVFFSSVAGRFGNRGQSDYAAANEALNKLALWLDRHWAARVVSIAWGPWSEIGMVSNLEGHLSRRGLGLVPPSVGTSRLIEELIHGRKGEVEVIVSGDLGPLGGPSWAREDQA